MMSNLEFEKPIVEIQKKIAELEKLGGSHGDNLDLAPELRKLEQKLETARTKVYGNLSSWQRIQIARHPKRPYTLDYIQMLATDFTEIHGDRLFADDLAMIAGFATIDEEKVMIIGHQKGRDTVENVKRNFGCAHPEGYRKAMRAMRLAERFGIPVVVFIDTPGAYPGIGAEERGQAQAIAENLRDMMDIKVPIVATVIGEGGSGGALGVGVADCILILQNAYYSVISPEGCASILWRSATKASEAAEALKLTGEHLIKFGIVDEIIPEPMGGAHQNPPMVANILKDAILKQLKRLKKLSTEKLLDERYAKFRKIGKFTTVGA
ncbi:MAG: acetyl-CoA carboxylase carboxyltransferase subunit alpha [Candidatus Omnitrophica bacterium]|nr:acetyl-CoA carboxylase carboxyltransferase subunit alpha [Candidatus Omnitrophota bacterium]